MRHLAVLALALVAGCSGTPGPLPAELTPLESPKPLRLLWSAPPAMRRSVMMVVAVAVCPGAFRRRLG